MIAQAVRAGMTRHMGECCRAHEQSESVRGLGLWCGWAALGWLEGWAPGGVAELEHGEGLCDSLAPSASELRWGGQGG